VVTLLVTVAVFLFVYSRSNGGSNGMVIATGALGTVSVLGTAVASIGERRRARKTKADLEESFHRKLADVELVLDALRGEEYQLRCHLDPDLEKLRLIALRRESRLWERRPGDPDFLRLRLGLVGQPTMFDFQIAAPPEETKLSLEAQRLVDEYGHLASVPLTSDLKMIGVLGISGEVELARDLARSLVCQLAVHQSPTEVVIAAVGTPENQDEWGWMKWLPHTTDSFLSVEDGPLVATRQPDVEQLLGRLEEEIQSREARSADAGYGGQRPLILPAIVLVVDGMRTLATNRDLAAILGNGLKNGVFGIVVEQDARALPGICGATVHLEGSLLRYQVAATGEENARVAPDGISRQAARELARALAPMRDGEIDSDAGIRAGLNLLDLVAMPSRDEDVIRGWGEGGLASRLRSPIGKRLDGETVFLDLRRDGPHGLVAGTTGSGKSELLQTIIASLALRHHPDHLNFVLIDYKGGAAFDAVTSLPHTVGVVTDLDGHLAQRALVALNSELKRREKFLRDSGAKDIIEYERNPSAKMPLPNLVIIIDEFASMAKEIPDFIDGLVGVAQRGRSLGVHLLLATQKPSGVVNDNIRANTNLRICLRVTDPQDSSDVIESNVAALIPRRLPGRAFFKVGTDLTEFQVARSAAAFRDPKAAVDDVIEVRGFGLGTVAERTVSLNGITLKGRRREGSVSRPIGESNEGPELTQLNVIVARINDAARKDNIQRRPSPWPAALPSRLLLTDVLAGGQSSGLESSARPSAPVGLFDEPQFQRQRVWVLDLEESGNLLAVGVTGSGKSVLLRTVAFALARLHSPADVQLYALDFGTRALQPLEGLPHCGAVIYSDQVERVRRLFRMLSDEIAARKRDLGASGAAVLSEHRARTAGISPPFWVVLLDNYGNFAEIFERIDQGRYIDELAMLVREGRSLGIHFIITAARRTSVPGSIAGVIQNRLALRQVEADEYTFAGVARGSVPEEMPPGRGFLAGSPTLEVQVALPVDQIDGIEQVRLLRSLVTEISEQVGVVPDDRRPRPVELLPDVVALADLMAGRWGQFIQGGDVLKIVLGLDEVEMAPAGIDLAKEGPHFLVAGPDRSGKSTALATILRGLASRYPTHELNMFVGSPRFSPLLDLRDLPHVVSIAESVEDLSHTIERLAREVQARIETRQVTPRLVVAIDDCEALTETTLGDQLEALARRGRDGGVHLVVAGRTDDLLRGYERWIVYLKTLRVGLLLSPDHDVDGDVFRLRLPRVSNPVYPPGRGFLVGGRAARLVQVAI
jgi:S-DNA-T family DNA segregation ATPase FtsK/SpoIIIE